ncbi:uncharacterized protein LOC126985651 isoform X1 [Eriocheir sinensis]|uniref:uncharacterized protein LOC126985651 isoform X1 n=2 Tax=Eriocheir sinensis TaxID=95602 RepID=UPI0021C799E8|nr:uncharacterized protein LOC126985651 isoform X1 [Eriocheir sinensis]
MWSMPRVMAGCDRDASFFTDVLCLLAHSKAKLTAGGTVPSDLESHTNGLAEQEEVEEEEIVDVEEEEDEKEPAPAQALNEAQALLKKVEGKRKSLEQELDRVNTQIAEVMSGNEELKAEIKKAQNKAEEVNLGHLQFVQTQEHRADTLTKEINKFLSMEMKVLEQEAEDLSAAQRNTTAALASDTREWHALTAHLRKKEREVYQELWRVEDDSTLLGEKSECWRKAEATSRRMGEEEGDSHRQALTALDTLTQDFTQVNARAGKVCLSLASHCLLPSHSVTSSAGNSSSSPPA